MAWQLQGAAGMTRGNRGQTERFLTLLNLEEVTALFSSQTSVTAIADTQSRSRNNSPTVQHRELRPSPETDPSSAAKPFSAAL
jgi:hypothetical protein